MKKFIKYLLIGFYLFNFGLLFGQSENSKVKRVLRSGSTVKSYEQLKRMAETSVSESRKLYLKALAETDAERAFQHYNTILNKFPESNEAQIACLKIGQYNFSRGLYVSARKYFEQLIAKYPSSDLTEAAAYNTAICLFAEKKFNLCSLSLKHFLSEYPHSKYKAVAKEDLKYAKSHRFVGENNSKNRKSENRGVYSVQIGAFTNVNSALNLKKEFAIEGFDVQIQTSVIKGTTFYKVLLNSFKTKNEAKEFGKTFSRKYGKPYRVVKR